jgi:hypothetical protein
VGRLLREILPPDAPAEAVESYALLVYHSYRFWEAGEQVRPISEEALRGAVGNQGISMHVAPAAQYLQLPELRVWGTPTAGSAPEPLDGMFVTQTGAAAIAVLAIFGLRPDRPGFSAVGLAPHSARNSLVARRRACTPSRTPVSCSCSPAESWPC